ncbi:leucine-rich repeat domain-containing protein [Sessilibacter corallicola]|uniref:leucine-rich repeat domain-containing protein n=1 Tax=Sessilibacter corallicola TaxID=2904075 RepID=UPI001E37908F|nr:leucine-rich repeat domain-containing protein [Sessilibacter corallicola]MCE2026786.1 leucine-rich repeat domain-containing protein [Sessilibacter corallicola]
MNSYRSIKRINSSGLAAKIFVLVVAGVLLAGCKNYQVSFNEREIYAPPQVITELSIDDSALKQCIELFIETEEIANYEDLATLTCSYAGVATLDGLNRFRKLTQINLSDNKLIDLSALQGLTELKQLSVKNNQVADIQPLFNLPKLNFLDISGNDSVRCEDLNQLKRVTGMEIVFPSQCQK